MADAPVARRYRVLEQCAVQRSRDPRGRHARGARFRNQLRAGIRRAVGAPAGKSGVFRLGAGLHTDNPYREPVPGFQVLHVLVASPDGGESIFGDGFAIAEHLRAAYPDDFAILARTAVPFLYRSRDAELYAERPLIQLTCSGEMSAVHYNSRSIAPLQLAAREAGPFYSAYRRFAALLRDPQFHLQIRLRDGDLTVFDNQRTLHGRTAFSSARHPRHLRGCYLTRDSVYSAAALLRREFHEAAPR